MILNCVIFKTKKENLLHKMEVFETISKVSYIRILNYNAIKVSVTFKQKFNLSFVTSKQKVKKSL